MSTASRPPQSDRFARPADRRNALDRSHRGDIRGAAGTVSATDTGPRHTHRRRLLTLLAVAGPGLIVMAADNDAGTISVFAQTGRSYGTGLLWVVVALAPLLYVVQEMAARLGAVTGAGHARLIRERFGRRWCAFSLADLLVVDFALLVTEFIGVRLALSSLGISRDVAVPLAAAGLIAVTSGGSFRRWERVMYVLVAANLAIIPLAIWHHPPAATVAHGLVPHLGAGAAQPTLLILIAMIGTSLAPWQIFFQQSTVVDKRITPRFLRYERIDTALGTLGFVAAAAAVMIVCAATVPGTPHLVLSDAGAIAGTLSARLGHTVGIVFAIALLNASLLAAGAVSLCSAYATSEVRGVKHSLHRRFRDARYFHAGFAVQVLAAAAIVLIPRLPLGALTTLVQALAAILLPSSLALLVMLCNDRELLGPAVNARWQNAVAVTALAAIVALSTMLTISTIAPGSGPATAIAVTAGLLLTGGAVIALAAARDARTTGDGDGDGDGRLTPWDRLTWSAPALERLGPTPRTRTRTVTLVLLRGYTVATIGLLLMRLGTLVAGG